MFGKVVLGKKVVPAFLKEGPVRHILAHQYVASLKLAVLKCFKGLQTQRLRLVLR